MKIFKRGSWVFGTNMNSYLSVRRIFWYIYIYIYNWMDNKFFLQKKHRSCFFFFWRENILKPGEETIMPRLHNPPHKRLTQSKRDMPREINQENSHKIQSQTNKTEGKRDPQLTGIRTTKQVKIKPLSKETAMPRDILLY